MSDLPRISVVTPSLNQAAFLEATLRSVLGQRYPALEFIVMDGGSNDGSAALIRSYEPELAHWTSAADSGQADAINRGFARATGEILCWLNSDDVHFPETLWRVAAQLGPRRHEPLVLTGSSVTFHEGEARGHFEPVAVFDRARLRRVDYLVQPATFWTAPAWQLTGALDVRLHYAFDWEWFLRAERAGCGFLTMPDLLAAYRLHAAHKSSSGGEKRCEEIAEVLRRHGDPAALAAVAWLRAHPRTWPAIARWSGWHWNGVPHALARALLPRLWQMPRSFEPEVLLECFHFLQLLPARP